jgi:hypothetical protein
VTADHAQGMACDTCHQPHRPRIEEQTQASTKKPTGGKE